MKEKTFYDKLKENSYPGRGIMLGTSEDGKNAVIVYFIMGRSANSRNRIFVNDKDGIRTQAFDEKKVTDPSLIIYRPVRVLGNKTIVSNGDQTDTIYEGMDKQLTFEQSLRNRVFEPDKPNYTPRISGIVRMEDETFHYALSIIKTDNGNPGSCLRFNFAYDTPVAGTGHYIHTYTCDGDPLQSFYGEPERVLIESDIDSFSKGVWESLDEENRISLFVRYLSISGADSYTRIINKNKKHE